MIQVPTIQELYARARADAQTLMESGAPIPTLSMLNVMIVVFVGLLRGIYGHLYNLSLWLIPDKAQGRFLDRFVSLYGIVPSTGSPAAGTVVFQGEPGVYGTVIPNATELKTVDGAKYYTLEESLITATGFSPEVQVRSRLTGTTTNYTGVSLVLDKPITGIKNTATIVDSIIGGSNADDENTLREKLTRTIRNPSTLGLNSDYTRIALSVVGVGRVWVSGGDFYSGPNTVSIVVATKENAPVSVLVLNEVQALLNNDQYEQVGMSAYVENLVVEPVNLTIKLIPNNVDTRGRCNTTLTALFTDGVAPSETLKISDIRSAISSAVPDDYVLQSVVIATVNQDITQNILGIPGKKYSLGTVTYVD